MGTTLFPKLEGKPKSHPLSSLFNYTRNSIACTLITGNKIIDFQMGVSMNLQVISKILSDNPGNQSYCHIPLFINMRHDKGNFILLSHRPAVIAGMCNGIDSVIPGWPLCSPAHPQGYVPEPVDARLPHAYLQTAPA